MIKDGYVYASLLNARWQKTRGRTVWGPRILMVCWSSFEDLFSDPLPATIPNVWFDCQGIT